MKFPIINLPTYAGVFRVMCFHDGCVQCAWCCGHKSPLREFFAAPDCNTNPPPSCPTPFPQINCERVCGCFFAFLALHLYPRFAPCTRIEPSSQITSYVTHPCYCLHVPISKQSMPAVLSQLESSVPEGRRNLPEAVVKARIFFRSNPPVSSITACTCPCAISQSSPKPIFFFPWPTRDPFPACHVSEIADYFSRFH